MIVQQGVDILKQLYQSKNDHIKVRAVVGLCKLGYEPNALPLRQFADTRPSHRNPNRKTQMCLLENLATFCTKQLINH